MESTLLKVLCLSLVLSGLVKLAMVGFGWKLARTRLAERWRVYRRALAAGQLRSEAWAAAGARAGQGLARIGERLPPMPAPSALPAGLERLSAGGSSDSYHTETSSTLNAVGM